MSQKYLGEFEVKLSESPFANYNPQDWAMHFIAVYSQIEGAHRKQWVLDQVARILKGTSVIVTQARWEHTEEYRVCLGEPSEDYLSWATAMRGQWVKTEEYEWWEYNYDAGIAP